MKKAIGAPRLLVAALLLIGGLQSAQGDEVTAARVSATHKGSLLVFSRVSLRWNAAGEIIQDTFVELTNDYPGDVQVQMYFVNGDEPLVSTNGEQVEPGWNATDVGISLTGDEPAYWSVLTGLPKGVAPFTVLDPGPPPGRPAGDGSGDRILRGFIVAWAVDAQGREIAWNHLSGRAVMTDYSNGAAWEYAPWAFQANSGRIGEQTDGNPGILLLNGGEYDLAYGQLLLDFPAVGSVLNTTGNSATVEDAELTLHVLQADLRQEGFELFTTLARFTIWNMNEVKFTGLSLPVRCWDTRPMSAYPIPNHFLRGNLHTDRGVARIEGLGSTQCADQGLPAALLGVISQRIRFASGESDEYATMIHGMGCEQAAILYDVSGTEPPERPAAQAPQGETNTATVRMETPAEAIVRSTQN